MAGEVAAVDADAEALRAQVGAGGGTSSNYEADAGPHPTASSIGLGGGSRAPHRPGACTLPLESLIGEAVTKAFAGGGAPMRLCSVAGCGTAFPGQAES